MSIFLDGVATQFYRGIGAETQFIGPLARINFFIGANNSGKSIVLNLLSEQLSKAKPGKNNRPLEGPQIHLGKETGQFLISVGRRHEALASSIISSTNAGSFRRRSSTTATFSSEIESICKRLAVGGLIWATQGREGPSEIIPTVDYRAARGWTTEWEGVWSVLTHRTGGGYEHWVPDTLREISRRLPPALPDIFMIPAKRVLSNEDEAFDDLSGKGLIGHLASLQNPSWNRQHDRDKFQQINRFLREVTGKVEATLEVPSGREHLLVHMDNKVLPLSSLGTGIHEVVLIAAFCTIHDGSIMCIEEPEIHLHPLLQRKLISYLIKNTNSQYFIATHSSAFIDTPGASIFRVTNDGEQTRVRPVLRKGQQREILDELGYHASDILQANAVVWVEGPSDRIYLKCWIGTADSQLEEGIHYTIMFYGGGLIRHLSASEDAVNEFIKLRDLNRNMAVVIDSDRDSSTSPLKPHAERLLNEIGKDGGVVWVTAGREMENYIDAAQLQSALSELHPKLYKGPGSIGQFDHAFYFYRESAKRPGSREIFKDGDKVGAASIVCRSQPQLDKLDLRERLKEVTSMIRRANGLPPNP